MAVLIRGIPVIIKAESLIRSTLVGYDFLDTLSKAIVQGFAKEMMADTLKQQLRDIAEGSFHYWHGIAYRTQN